MSVKHSASIKNRHMIDVGNGRHLYCVQFNQEADGPFALYDAGAFGCFADGMWVCRALTQQGFRAATYSRAGLYPSDPLPDGVDPEPFFHVEDMIRLLDKLGQSDPILLVSHSMGGIRAHAFAAQYPERIGAVLLLDAVLPAQLNMPVRREFARAGARSISLCESSIGARLVKSYMKYYPNSMRLENEDRDHKYKSYASTDHFTGTRREILATSEPTLAPQLPDITHCPVGFVRVTQVAAGTSAAVRRAQERGQPVRHLHLKDARHNSMLSPRFAGQLARMGQDIWSLRREGGLPPAQKAVTDLRDIAPAG